MKNLRNKNQPVNADLVQVYLQSSWDIVTAVYAELANIQTLADQINGPGLNFLTAADIDTLAELNAILTDAQLGRFSTQAEAEAGLDNTTTMTPLRVAQAIAILAAGLQNNYSAVVPPTVTDDSNAGYSVGSYWIDISAQETWRCIDATVGAAVWILTTLTADELASVALSGDSDDLIEGVTQLLLTAAERSKLAGIEALATADQTDAEIETAYNNQVAIVPQAEAEAGVATTVRRWTAERVGQAIAALGGGGGGLTWTSANTSQAVTASSGWVFYGLAADVTATLPVSPNVGDSIMLVNNDNDPTDSYDVNIAAGGSNEIIEQNISYIPQAVLKQGQTALLVCREAGATKRWHMQRWTSALDIGAGGGGVNALFKTGAYTAAAGDIVLVGSDTAAVTITLPATPTTDDYVAVWDADDGASTNNITIARNGETIDGNAFDFIIDMNGGKVDLIYDGTTWRVTYAAPSATVQQSMTNLGTTTLVSASNILEVTGLDLSAYSSFYIQAQLKEATGGGPLVKLYYNSDTTDANYHRASVYHTTTTAAQRSNTGYLFALSANGVADVHIRITSDLDGKARARYECAIDSGTSVGGWIGTHTWVTAANVTAIQLNASIASSLLAGSTMTVWGIK